MRHTGSFWDDLKQIQRLSKIGCSSNRRCIGEVMRRGVNLAYGE
jgi:hypothetical protein